MSAVKARESTQFLLKDLVELGYIAGNGVTAVEHALVIAYQQGNIDSMIENIDHMLRAKRERSQAIANSPDIAVFKRQAE